jgi:hypothetical protein
MTLQSPFIGAGAVFPGANYSEVDPSLRNGPEKLGAVSSAVVAQPRWQSLPGRRPVQVNESEIVPGMLVGLVKADEVQHRRKYALGV